MHPIVYQVDAFTAIHLRGNLPASGFISRFFAPAVALDEDPVTGSARCLAPYWLSGQAVTVFKSELLTL